MKAASLILQFVLFFMIGLGFFLMAGNLFRFQSGIIKTDVIDLGSTYSLSQMSAASIRTVSSCKSCDSVSITIGQASIAGNSPIYQLSNGIILEIAPENKVEQSSIHNLHYSVTYDTIKVSSAKDITLTYDRTKNKLVIE